VIMLYELSIISARIMVKTPEYDDDDDEA